MQPYRLQLYLSIKGNTEMKLAIYTAALLLFGVLFNGNSVSAQGGGDCIDPSLIDPNAFCPFIYDPVCGCDGITYSNDCIAQTTAGVTSWTMGECQQGGFEFCIDPGQIDLTVLCIQIWDPVCGCNGVTYSNECHAIYYGGVTSYTPGECPTANCIDQEQLDPNHSCPEILQQVCGCDGVTYSNECEAIYYGGVTSFSSGACGGGECINPAQIDETMMCIQVFDPVCGCDGVTYQNDCYAFYYGGVTSWTPGECGTGPSTCADLSDADFGDCEAVVGVGQVDGECVWISGCGTIDLNTGIDLVGNIFPSIAACQSSCGEICVDLEGVDFGDCDFELGVGIVNGECTSITGCDYTDVNGYDFSQHIFSTAEQCLEICAETPCIDPDQIDPNAGCADFFVPVCGCDSVSYLNSCVAFSYNGVTEYADGPCVSPGQCIVEEQIVPEFECFDNIDPVCGCNDVTYQNACVAFNHYGVQAWISGPCINSVEETDFVQAVYPNPFNDQFEVLLNQRTDMNWILHDLTGRIILNGFITGADRLSVDASELAPGVYVLSLQAGEKYISRRLVKE